MPELVDAIRRRHASSPQERTFLRPVLRDMTDAMVGLEQETLRRVKIAEEKLEAMRRVAEAGGYWEAHQEGARAGEARARREMADEVARAERLRGQLRDGVARLMVHSGELQGILWIARELEVLVREERGR